MDKAINPNAISEATEKLLTISAGIKFVINGPKTKPAIKYPVTFGILICFTNLPQINADNIIIAISNKILSLMFLYPLCEIYRNTENNSHIFLAECG